MKGQCPRHHSRSRARRACAACDPDSFVHPNLPSHDEPRGDGSKTRRDSEVRKCHGARLLASNRRYSCFVHEATAHGHARRHGKGDTRVPASLVRRAEAERKSARRPVSRVLSAPFGARRPFLWDVPRGTPHATNPGGETGMSPLRPVRTVATAPIRSCSRWGLPCRPRHRGRGALLPPRFTLAHQGFPPHGRFVFCGTVPGVAPAGR